MRSDGRSSEGLKSRSSIGLQTFLLLFKRFQYMTFVGLQYDAHRGFQQMIFRKSHYKALIGISVGGLKIFIKKN